MAIFHFPESPAQRDSPQWFTTTHWSVVLHAHEGAANRDTALESLCHTYWYPLYAFVRRRGYEPHDAQDLTQEFFARLIGKDYLAAVDRNKGKFRSFLLAALDHFLAKEWRKAHAQKRGGNCGFFSLDDDSAEQRYAQLPHSVSPERLFEQQWAATLLNEVLSRLQKEFADAGKAALFEELKVFLTGDTGESYAELALRVKSTEAALKMAVSRMRRRYGELLREQIANTVSRPAEVDEELRALFAALS